MNRFEELCKRNRFVKSIYEEATKEAQARLLPCRFLVRVTKCNRLHWIGRTDSAAEALVRRL